MFSPAQNGAPPAPSQRTSRRRQRPLSSELSVSEPKRKRLRSALSENTFQPPDGAPEMSEKHSKIATLGKVNDGPVQSRELAVRGKKSRSVERGHKGDGSTILASNDMYTVARLPALPDRLRTEHERRNRQHGGIYPDSGYALTLTHSSVTVWPYAESNPSPETFTFTLPHPSKHVSDPLPLGSLVSASASTPEPGLVVVIPTTGTITYWESISSAATLDLRLQRNGVELVIPGMFSGERVVQILNAEPAGFVLAFSTGRTAYMSVRDGHGRPAISVQFLRGASGPISGGLFGSLRNVLSSSAWRGDIAAVRAGHVDRVGERTVVIATAKGKLQNWNMHRGGHTSLIAEAECGEGIVMAVKNAAPALGELLLESFETLDFTFTPRSLANSQLSQYDDNGAHLLLMISLAGRNQSHYYLVEGVLKPGEFEILNLRPITSYTTPLSRTAVSKPRLYLPNPALVAYITFDRAVIVMSMAKQPDSPDSQLWNESHLLPQAFEDVVDFREDMNVEIVGSGMEEPYASAHAAEDPKSKRYKAKYPAVVLIVRGGGIVRIAATNITKLTTNKSQQVTAKSKLEQAVFFGTLDQNPINFSVRQELRFSAEEIGSAALELSSAILRSEVAYIPSVPVSLEQNLKKRSAALHDLAQYLKSSGVTLDRVTKWRLLWDAEKMMAATLIWKRYEAIIRDKPPGERRGLLTEVVESIHENYKTNPVPEAGELDRVRHWFIKDIWNIEIAVPWAYQVIKYTWQDGEKDHGLVLQILSEADDLVLSALQGAFEFRTANLDLYDLSAEQLEHGVLKGNFDGLPEFWTSTTYITENLRKQAELAGVLVDNYWEKPHDQQPNHILLNKVRNEYPRLLDITIRSNTERIRWLSAQDSQDFHIEAEEIKAVQARAQEQHILMLADNLGMPDEAIDLAEKHEILPTLAYILKFETSPDGLQRHTYEDAEVRLQSIRYRIQSLFDRYGTKWANALFQFEIENDSLAELLDTRPKQRAYLTDYLRSKPEYAKISWINEAVNERDYNRASETLLRLGFHRETDEWTKKIELSIGKLALLATDSSPLKDVSVTEGQSDKLTTINNQLELIKIQDQVFSLVLPAINDAIDENAELQLALEVHANKSLKKLQSFQSLLNESMAHLIKHQTMDALSLIDLLTLIGASGASGEQEALRSQQFYLALRATRFGLSKHDQLLVQRIIWRRCMLRDDWSEINNTASKDDQEVSEQLARTVLYQTFKACLKAGMFGKDSLVQPLAPQEVLGAGTEELDQRFNGLDASIRETIMKDMQNEDDALKPMIERHRLDKWQQSALDQAKVDFAKGIDDETDGGRLMQDAEAKLEEVERQIKESELAKAESLLHSKPRHKANGKLNGSVGQFGSSFQR